MLFVLYVIHLIELTQLLFLSSRKSFLLKNLFNSRVSSSCTIFHFKKLPLSFANTWITNIERIPERALRNANDLFIPPHRVEFVKRLPLYTLPLAWNTAPGEKLNPRHHLYLKELKNVLLSSIKNVLTTI